MLSDGRKLCYYTIARFIPNIIRDEAKNIGILFFNETDKQYFSKFMDVDKLKLKLGDDVYYSDMQILQHGFDYFHTFHPNSKAELEDCITRCIGKFQFTEIRAVAIDDFGAEADYLYKLFVD